MLTACEASSRYYHISLFSYFIILIKRLELGREIGIASVGARIVNTPCHRQHPSPAPSTAV